MVGEGEGRKGRGRKGGSLAERRQRQMGHGYLISYIVVHLWLSSHHRPAVFYYEPVGATLYIDMRDEVIQPHVSSLVFTIVHMNSRYKYHMYIFLNGQKKCSFSTLHTEYSCL